MSTSRPEDQRQLDDYPLGFSDGLYRPKSYCNRLDSSSNARLGRLVDNSGSVVAALKPEPLSLLACSSLLP